MYPAHQVVSVARHSLFPNDLSQIHRIRENPNIYQEYPNLFARRCGFNCCRYYNFYLSLGTSAYSIGSLQGL